MRELDRYTLRLHRYTPPSGGPIRDIALEATTARSDDGAIVWYEDVAKDLAIAAAAREYVDLASNHTRLADGGDIYDSYVALVAAVRG